MKTFIKFSLIVILIIAVCHFFVGTIGFKQAAIGRLNECKNVTDILGVPIKENIWSLAYGNAQSSGGSGTASWRMGVEGPKGTGKFEFYSEKHGGIWNLTAAQVTVSEHKIDLKNCDRKNVQNSPDHSDFLMTKVEDCNDGKATECQLLGILYLRGTSVEKNLKQAKFYLEKACDLGIQARSSESCDYAIHLFSDGKEAVADPFEVARIREKLDSLKGLVHKDQVLDVVTTNAKECDSQSINALDACIMLGRQYAENPEVKRDLKKAYSYVSRACDLSYLKKHTNLGRNPWAECYYVTEFYHHGEHGFPVDLTQAMKFAEIICNLDLQFKPVEPRGCTEAAKLIDELIGKGSPQAERDRKRACESGDPDSCR